MKGLPLSPKPTRIEVSNELAYSDVRKISKTSDELMRMDADALNEYFKSVRPTNREILDLLGELGVPVGSDDKKRGLFRFAAREISDMGMYQRIATRSAPSK